MLVKMVKRKFVKMCSILMAAALITGCGSTPAGSSNSSSTSQEQETGGLPDKMPSFTTKDLEGNTITDSIFKEKDLTVVNIWGTFCGPCIGEMPELAEWSEEMPENVQLIGLVCDIEGEDDSRRKDLAAGIMEEAGADFTNIIPGKSFNSLLEWITGVPTTIFVDKEGNITGEPVIGADVNAYKKFVKGYINGK